MASGNKVHLVHVKLGHDEKTITGGPTPLAQLKVELGVSPTDILYLVKGHDQRPLGDEEIVDVEDGMHFEAVPGGGVS